MVKTIKRRMTAVLLALGCLPTLAAAKSPTDQIQETIQQVVRVVASPGRSDQARREVLKEMLLPHFDWLDMSRQALGSHWKSASGRENEFVSAFAEFLGNAYVGQINSYRDEKIFIVQELIDNNQAQVKTRIESKKGEPTAVDYRLHRVQGEWKIYDVVVEDVSIVSNYRAQFNRILTKGSLDDLMSQLTAKDSPTH